MLKRVCSFGGTVAYGQPPPPLDLRLPPSQDDDQFQELDDFNAYMESAYGFKMLEYGPGNMIDCLFALTKDRPFLRAIYMGQRKTDPGGRKLGLIEKCDPGWPQVDRINPMLDWSYIQVWDFLMHYKLPFCRLYELGYTSLGSRALTLPNPRLRKGGLRDSYPLDYTPALTPCTANRVPSAPSQTKDDKGESKHDGNSNNNNSNNNHNNSNNHNSSNNNAPLVSASDSFIHLLRQYQTYTANASPLYTPKSFPSSSSSFSPTTTTTTSSSASTMHTSTTDPTHSTVPTTSYTGPPELYNSNFIESSAITVLGTTIHLERWPYYPAFVLTDDEAERLGRLPKPQPPQSSSSSSPSSTSTSSSTSSSAPAASTATVGTTNRSTSSLPTTYTSLSLAGASTSSSSSPSPLLVPATVSGTFPSMLNTFPSTLNTYPSTLNTYPLTLKLARVTAPDNYTTQSHVLATSSMTTSGASSSSSFSSSSSCSSAFCSATVHDVLLVPLEHKRRYTNTHSPSFSASFSSIPSARHISLSHPLNTPPFPPASSSSFTAIEMHSHRSDRSSPFLLCDADGNITNAFSSML